MRCTTWLLAPLFALVLAAQSKTSASLRGVVVDASEARVSLARVTLTNGAANARFETVIGDQGTYLLPSSSQENIEWKWQRTTLHLGSGTA